VLELVAMLRGRLGGSLLVIGLLTVLGPYPALAMPSKAVLRANAMCVRDDDAISNAEEIAPTVVFTLNTVHQIELEVTGLDALGLEARLRTSFADFQTALTEIESGSAGIRTIDGILLHARSAAARAGVKCSFGARPLLGLE
jgi:hypothetical protein